MPRLGFVGARPSVDTRKPVAAFHPAGLGAAAGHETQRLRPSRSLLHYQSVINTIDERLTDLIYYQSVMKKQVTAAEVGARIREIRRAQGVSQETLAGLAGTGQRYISELERGKTTARLGEMLKVLNALGAGLYVLSQDEAVEWIR